MEGSRLPEPELDLRWDDARLWPQFAARAEAEPDALALVDPRGSVVDAT